MKKYIKILLLCLIGTMLIGCKNAERRRIKKIEQSEKLKQYSEMINVANFQELQNNVYTIGTDINIRFDKIIEEESLNTETVKLVRVDTNETLEIELTYSKPYLIIHPMEKFKSVGETVNFLGIKPDTEYVIELDTVNIQGEEGEKLAPVFSELLIKAQKLNYGIYWFGKDGYCQKYVEGVKNRYYDPEKSVVLHSHGWQINKISNDYWIDQPYIVNNRFYKNEIANDWIEKGYNIGAWVWGQFADELNVNDAEAKIWDGLNGFKNMRYRMKDRNYLEFETDKSIHELLYDTYISALKDFKGREIRLTGHSLGNQVITALAGKVAYEVDHGNLSEMYIPDRIVLLDSFWSLFEKSYLNNMQTGEFCTDIIENLITTKGVVVEEIKSSEIGNTISGDNNAELRKLTAFTRIWSSKIPLLDLEARHAYSTDWYFNSIKADINVESGKIGAKSGIEEIRNTMNYFKKDKSYWLQYRGTSTISTEDDEFVEVQSMITF